MRSSVILGGLLVLAGCSGRNVAERQLRIASRTRIDADSMIEIRGGHLRDLDRRRVTIKAFALDATEVTVEAYRRCITAGACGIAPERSTRGCNLERLYVEQHPVNCVSIREAEAFCRWRGARLPTLHEWQWAAQGRGQARRYVWGHFPRHRVLRVFDTFDPFVCAEVRMPGADARTCSVGRYDRTRDGLADLGGNVAEWVYADSRRGGLAVGQSYDYPQVTTRTFFDRTYRPPADAIRQTIALNRREPHVEPDAWVGFRCAKTLP